MALPPELRVALAAGLVRAVQRAVRTDDADGRRWVHMVCAFWIPEVSFANAVFLELVIDLHRIARLLPLREAQPRLARVFSSLLALYLLYLSGD